MQKTFKLKKKSKSQITFENSYYSDRGLWLFVMISPDSKKNSICVYIGWSSNGAVPLYMVDDIRALDINGQEHELESHCFEMRKLISENDPYEVLPLPSGVEQLRDYLVPLESAWAAEIVRPILEKIQKDLNVYANSYFDWLISKKLD